MLSAQPVLEQGESDPAGNRAKGHISSTASGNRRRGRGDQVAVVPGDRPHGFNLATPTSSNAALLDFRAK